MGQSGAPIYQIGMIKSNNLDGDNRELIGIHVGKYYNIKTGVGLWKHILEWITNDKEE